MRRHDPTPPPPRPWHALALREALGEVAAGERGLTEAEAAARLARHGPNRLPTAPEPSLLAILVRQFKSPLILVLGIAAVVSLGIGEVTDAAFIVGVLVLNASIGGTQEWRAERSSRALQGLLRTHATVLRDGEAREIDGEAVVPGDVVLLESGERVPADLRLLTAQGLEVDESLLTGESLPVLKDAAWTSAERAPLGDRRNMAHAGSMVSHGRGRGAVVATGADTVVGRLAVDVAGATQGKPPLLVRLERFTRVIGFGALAAAALVGVLGVVARGHAPEEMFLFAVALAVSAIPEGLPVAMTVALSVATKRMARRGVIVRRLAAVEGLGSCTLIASDKTGTLTCNELTVRRAVLADGTELEVTGEGYAPAGEVLCGGRAVGPEQHAALSGLARAAVLCNEAALYRRDGAWSWTGDPTDVALLAFAHKAGQERERALADHPQVNQIPFEPERRYAASHHRCAEGVRVFVKGAPERVLAMCAADAPTGDARADALRLAEAGFRVLALAEGPAPAELDASVAPPEPEGLALLGLVGMLDPLRPGANDAVRACRAAGIAVSMVTGDHPVTALAIARELGFASLPEEVVTGDRIAELDEAQLAELVGRTRVFARTSPHQKLQIVDAARRAGHFVAVTGDGVNDAPALKAANIGVAMGRAGTDVAREAAELVISDDNFATVVAGVEEGRVAYDNVRKVVYLLISTGAAEVVLVLLSLVAGLPLPLLPVQLLWLNLVTNGIQDVALAFEPAEEGVLRRPPRSPRERILDRLMLERTVVGALVMGGVGFAAFRWLLAAGHSEETARNLLLLLMVLFENVHIGNCRSETVSALRRSPLASPVLLGGTLLAFGIHVTALFWAPLRALLGTAPVALRDWAVLLALALLLLAAMELHKWSWAGRRGRARAA